jgi:nickel-dependent lactate racemase
MSSTITLRTGAWYGDDEIDLRVPSHWDVKIHWPVLPAALSEEEIADALNRPVGYRSWNEICKGKSRPLIIVDDLNRPTPTARIMPVLLKIFNDAGIDAKQVTVLMATGTHGTPPADAMMKKIGVRASSVCRLKVHDCFHNNVRIGTTSFGTPVFADEAILESDLVIGIGGVYPNHTAGFGGGAKLALGTLGMRSIFSLHFRHQSVGWGSLGVESTFRKDLNEISQMVGMHIGISLQVNPNREIIKIDCGKHEDYYVDASNFCRSTFATPPPDDADVIISNAYPNDLSLEFARMKGFVPLNNGKPSASRIAIARCDEGLGLHNIFPYVNIPRYHRQRHLMRHLLMMSPGEIASKSLRKVSQKFSNKLTRSKAGSNIVVDQQSPKRSYPVWLFRPGNGQSSLPSRVRDINIITQWSEILDIVGREQGSKSRPKVVVYPCAFLQSLAPARESVESASSVVSTE